MGYGRYKWGKQTGHMWYELDIDAEQANWVASEQNIEGRDKVNMCHSKPGNETMLK